MTKFRDDPSDELRNGRSCCGLHRHAMAVQQLDVDGSLSCAVVGPVAIVMVRELAAANLPPWLAGVITRRLRDEKSFPSPP